MKRLHTVVLESPLKGDFARNRLYATWCCRDLYERGFSPIASHLIAPWFMDDRVDEERQAGMDMPWFWQVDVPHCFYVDLGVSGGMAAAKARCQQAHIPISDEHRLPRLYWEAFLHGEAPPHTPGFAMPRPERDTKLVEAMTAHLATLPHTLRRDCFWRPVFALLEGGDGFGDSPVGSRALSSRHD